MRLHGAVHTVQLIPARARGSTARGICVIGQGGTYLYILKSFSSHEKGFIMWIIDKMLISDYGLVPSI